MTVQVVTDIGGQLDWFMVHGSRVQKMRSRAGLLMRARKGRHLMSCYRLTGVVWLADRAPSATGDGEY